MIRTAYIDCIAGASGDMLLGALVDAGLEPGRLEQFLRGVPARDFHLHCAKVSKNGFGATKVDVHVHDDAPERHLAELLDLVAASQIPDSVKDRAARVFRRICECEAAIHGKSVDEVHLHEVGGVDAIVDVIGVLGGFELLGIEQVIVSPLPMGRGFIHGAHGMIPLPAPAAIALLHGVPLTGSPIEAELVTPTGAALLTELAHSWGPIPHLTLEHIGYGAGTRDLPIPNLLRILIGQSTHPTPWSSQEVVLLETNIDDQSGETLGHATRQLLDHGALDVTTIPAQMKKNRPGSILQVLSHPHNADHLESLLFNETSTLGIRRSSLRRDALPRTIESVETRFGTIRVKLSQLPNGHTHLKAEFDDCQQAASSHGVSLHSVQHAAEHAAAHLFGIDH